MPSEKVYIIPYLTLPYLNYQIYRSDPIARRLRNGREL